MTLSSPRAAARNSFVVGLLLALSSCAGPSTIDGERIGTGRIQSVLYSIGVSSYIISATPFDEELSPGADRRVILIDTGVAEEDGANPLASALESLGRTPDDVAAVFFTHGHTDHIGNASLVQDAPFYSFFGDKGLIEGTEAAVRPFPSGDPEATGLTVDETLTDGQVLSIAGIDIQAFAIPGHSAGSGAFLVDGALFLGDSVRVGAEGELEGPTWLFSTDTAQSDKSLSALAARLDYEQLTVTHVVGSHSAASSEGLSLLRRYVDRLQVP